MTNDSGCIAARSALAKLDPPWARRGRFSAEYPSECDLANIEHYAQQAFLAGLSRDGVVNCSIALAQKIIDRHIDGVIALAGELRLRGLIANTELAALLAPVHADGWARRELERALAAVLAALQQCITYETI